MYACFGTRYVHLARYSRGHGFAGSQELTTSYLWLRPSWYCRLQSKSLDLLAMSWNLIIVLRSKLCRSCKTTQGLPRAGRLGSLGFSEASTVLYPLPKCFGHLAEGLLLLLLLSNKHVALCWHARERDLSHLILSQPFLCASQAWGSCPQRPCHWASGRLLGAAHSLMTPPLEDPG